MSAPPRLTQQLRRVASSHVSSSATGFNSWCDLKTCLSGLFRSGVLNGAGGPMVDRTTGSRYLPGAALQSGFNSHCLCVLGDN